MKYVTGSSAIVAGLFFCALSNDSQSPPDTVAVHTVNAMCCGFQDPANGNSSETIIGQGVTVQWVRTDFNNHTVTNGTAPGGPGSGTIFNGSLTAGTPTFDFMFNTLGTFPYFCTPHFTFGMTGTVYVVPPASSTSTGTGCPTSTGQNATLASSSPPTIGNGAYGLTVGGGPVGAQAYIFVAATTGPPVQVIPGCFVYLDLVSLGALMQAGLTPTGPQPLGPGGTTTFAIPLPNSGPLGGATAAIQGIIIDPLAPSGLALSNAITIVVGI